MSESQGLDHLVMVLCGANSLRNVVAFSKTPADLSSNETFKSSKKRLTQPEGGLPESSLASPRLWTKLAPRPKEIC